MGAHSMPSRSPDEGDGGEQAERYPVLVVGGVLLLLAGAACAVFAAFTVLGLAMSWRAGGATSVRWSLPALLWYTAGAAALIWTGVGSLLARRWARAVAVAGSAVWLVRGGLSLVAAVLALPLMVEAAPAIPGAEQSWVGTLMATLTIGFSAVGGVLVPAVLLVLYTRPGVRLTFEQRDAGPSWTDRCPSGVLALAAALVAASLYEGVAAASGMPNLFFGYLLTESGALAAGLGTALLAALLAIGIFRLQPLAWWGGLVYAATWAVSALLAVRVELGPVYEEMGFGAEWAAGPWGAYASFSSKVEAWSLAIAALIWIGGAVLQRRHFRSSPAAI